MYNIKNSKKYKSRHISKKILVVGGTGFLGFHLLKKALSKNFSTFCFSRSKPKKTRYLDNVKYILGDVGKKNSLKKLLNYNFDFVVNLSGNVDHNKKKSVFKSHFEGCKNLSNLFLKKKILSFIQISSSSEYGKLKSPQKENQKCKPISFYGIAKNQSTKYLINLYNKKKFPVTILRLYQVYGPNQDPNRLIPYTIDACKRNVPFICSSGEQYRDFIHVDDFCEAIFKILKTKESLGEIINIGYGQAIKIKKIIQNINMILRGGKPLFGKLKLRNDELIKTFPSLKKAKKILNWEAKILFDKGLKKTINSYNL